jgi:hypothetical protein
MKEYLPGAFYPDKGDYLEYLPAGCPFCRARQVQKFNEELYGTDPDTWFVIPHVCNLGDQLL